MQLHSRLNLTLPSVPRVGARFVSDLFDDDALYETLRLTGFLEARWTSQPEHPGLPGLSCVRRRLPLVVLRETAQAVGALRDSMALLQALSPGLCRAECEARRSLDALDAALSYLFDDDTQGDAPEDLELSELHAKRDCDDDPLALCENLRRAAALAERFADSLAVLDERFTRGSLREAVGRADALEKQLREELPLRPELDSGLLCRAVHARHLFRCLREVERAAEYVFRRGQGALPAQAAKRYRLRDEHPAEPSAES